MRVIFLPARIIVQRNIYRGAKEYFVNTSNNDSNFFWRFEITSTHFQFYFHVLFHLFSIRFWSKPSHLQAYSRLSWLRRRLLLDMDNCCRLQNYFNIQYENLVKDCLRHLDIVMATYYHAPRLPSSSHWFIDHIRWLQNMHLCCKNPRLRTKNFWE